MNFHQQGAEPKESKYKFRHCDYRTSFQELSWLAKGKQVSEVPDTVIVTYSLLYRLGLKVRTSDLF